MKDGDYVEFKKFIRSQSAALGLTPYDVAAMAGINDRTFQRRLQKKDWSVREYVRIMDVLAATDQERTEYLQELGR